MNQGDKWEAISPDLTQGGKKGNVAYGTLTTISESPFKFGLLYVGSDDGLIHMTKDGGGNWEDVSGSLPKDLWVSRVVASKHKIGRVYASLNGYRWDDFTPYVYKSEDFGKTWESISKGLPLSPVNAIVEDPENENLLFVGTDDGLYATLDQGASWNWFQGGIPYVAVHDLVIQKDAKHLVAGTHGRSIYRADISPLQKLNADVIESPLTVFELKDIRHSSRWGSSYSTWGKPQTPGLDIVFYSADANSYTAFIKYQDIVVSEVSLVADPGINILSYDLAFSKKGKSEYLKKIKRELKTAKDGKTYLPKGKYTVEVQGGRNTDKATFEIK